MKLQFLGCGGMFAKPDQYQTNSILTAPSGKRLLIDFGRTAPEALEEATGIDSFTLPTEVDGVYITHTHGDHVAGLDQLAYAYYFIGGAKADSSKRPKLYAADSVLDDLWEHSLKGSLASLENKVVDVSEYFDCCSIPNDGSFIWEGIKFDLIQFVHVASGRYIKPCYGFMFQRVGSTENLHKYAIPPRRKGTDIFKKGALEEKVNTVGPKVLYAFDTQMQDYLQAFYDEADVIFHDCETGFKSNVHAHYDDLKQLPEATKAKMWLAHYSSNTIDAEEDGFRGFIRKGQEFDIAGVRG